MCLRLTEMKVSLSLSAFGCDGEGRTYKYSVELPEGTPLEQVEAHAKNINRILDEQANETEDDDGEDDEKWKTKA